jgi:hypothetical protein
MVRPHQALVSAEILDLPAMANQNNIGALVGRAALLRRRFG